MSLADFKAEPWRNSHPIYANSAFNIYPAPEYASSEVVVASVYRAVGFKNHSEAAVPAAGRDFDKLTRRVSSSRSGDASIGVDTWLTVLHGALESPKLPNQSARRFLQLSPIVPDVALYSGTARSSGSSWNPGSLVERMVRLGSMTEGAADLLWRQLFDSLSVTEGDDVWARWLQSEFVRRRKPGTDWAYASLGDGPDMPFAEKATLEFPARQFVRDLQAILGAKDKMTRRQWISLLESILRLGCVTHVLWLCDVNARLWAMAREILAGGVVPNDEVLNRKLFASKSSYLVHGNPSLRIIRDYASSYLVARLGLNCLLWRMDPNGTRRDQMSSCGDLKEFFREIEMSRETLAAPSADDLGVLHEQHARTLACKKGIGSNLLEFGRHVLGQRQTANESLRGYDQGYFLRKKGQHLSAPWVVSLGPVALLAVVHCCLDEVAGPRSVDRLCQHLSRYGLGVDTDDIAESDIGHKLRMLGLVLDSPDAESGMLLVPPFQVSRVEGGAAT